MKNNHGFSLVEVMVGAGISIVIGLAVLAMSRAMVNSAAGAKANQDVNEASSSILTILGNTTLCQEAFVNAADQPVTFSTVATTSGPGVATNLEKIRMHGTPVLAAGENLGGLRLQSWRLELPENSKISDVLRPGAGGTLVTHELHNAILTLTYVRTNTETTIANQLKPREYKFTALINPATRQMTGCVGIESTEAFCRNALGGEYDPAQFPSCNLRRFSYGPQHSLRNPAGSLVESFANAPGISVNTGGLYVDATNNAANEHALQLGKTGASQFRWTFDKDGTASFISAPYLTSAPAIRPTAAAVTGMTAGNPATSSAQKGLMLQGGQISVYGLLNDNPLLYLYTPQGAGESSLSFARNGLLTLWSNAQDATLSTNRVTSPTTSGLVLNSAAGNMVLTTPGTAEVSIPGRASITDLITRGSLRSNSLSISDIASGGAERIRLDSSGNMTANGVITGTLIRATSDERKKKDIQPLNGSLAKILTLKGVSFRWRDSGKWDVGLIAQNIQKVFPALVDKGADGVLHVNFLGLFGPVVESIRELDQKCELNSQTQSRKITELESRLQAMEEKLHRLETLAREAR